MLSKGGLERSNNNVQLMWAMEVWVQEMSKSQAVIDGEAAVGALGEDRMKKAVRALLKGEMTEDVEALVNWQISQGDGLH